MKIYIIGNSLLTNDNLPFLVLPALENAFQEVEFEEADPNENFIPEEGSIILDTVEGLSEARIFDSLDAFVTTRSVSPHDYDLGFHLQLLIKLGKIHNVKILGLPRKHLSDTFLQQVISLIKKEQEQELRLLK
jgi:hypothetical protein